MSFVHLRNGLLKACQRLAISLQSKLQKLRRSRTTGRATEHLVSVISALIRCKKKLREELQHRQGRRRHRQRGVYPYSSTRDEVCYSSIATASSSSSSWYSSLAFEAMAVVVELDDVNVQSDIFIAMNKEFWRLENQRSIEDYREMLARGM